MLQSTGSQKVGYNLATGQQLYLVISCNGNRPSDVELAKLRMLGIKGTVTGKIDVLLLQIQLGQFKINIVIIDLSEKCKC